MITFDEFLGLNDVLSARYGQDDVAWIDFSTHEQAGLHEKSPDDILSKNG